MTETQLLPYAIFDAASRKVLRCGKTATAREAFAKLRDGEDIVLGEEYPPGAVVSADERSCVHAPAAIVVTPAEVKAHARRLLRDTDWLVVRAMEDGAKPMPEAVRKQRAAIRARSAVIEAMQPIPADYQDQKYWTDPTAGRSA
jgi:hypothetical protein